MTPRAGPRGAGGSEAGATLRVRVVPRASRTRIVGWQPDGCLAVRVAAPPEGGRANEAVVELLAGALSLRPRELVILAGHASRTKTVAVRGLGEEELRRRLAAHLERG